MKQCKICRRVLDEIMFYSTRTKHRKEDTYYSGTRRECKACTLNRNEKERDLWRDGLFSVYILPHENYCGYTNNVRHRINQHRRAGKNVKDHQVVFVSSNQIEAHLVETEYHLKGYGGFKANLGKYKRRVHYDRHLLQTELEGTTMTSLDKVGKWVKVKDMADYLNKTWYDKDTI